MTTRLEILKGIYKRRGLAGTAAVFLIGPFALLLGATGSILVSVGRWMQDTSGAPHGGV